MDQREGGGREYHDFLSKSFLSHSFEKFRRGTLLCFTNFLVSKNVRDKRGSGHHDFPSKMFCLTVPNHFVEEPFCVSESFGNQKILSPRGENHDFYRNFVVSQYQKNFVGEPFCVSKKFWNQKNFVGEPFCVSKNFWYQKKLCIRGKGRRKGVSRLSVGKFFVSQCQKNS